jgi:E3 ubiquitin-protein ligase HECTD1
LTNAHEGNLHEKGIVEVSASGTFWSDIPPKEVVDFKSSLQGFATPNVANSWIQIDFRNYRLIPTHYSVRNRIDVDGNHLRNWVVEGSEDGTTWIELDRHENDCVLRGVGGAHTFSISHPSRFPMIRMIRLHQTGVNSNGNDWLVLKSIEFFGQLICPAQ